MKVGILLLSIDDVYLDCNGNLPRRPRFDKELLLGLTRGHKIVAGPNTMRALPDSVLGHAEVVAWEEDYDVNLGIVTMSVNPPHLLIVVRNRTKLRCGKKFDLTPYDSVFKSLHLELWIFRGPA